MYCKHCGLQNPDDANFCISCGTAIISVQSLKSEKIKNKVVADQSSGGKPNAFQKILLLICLIWVVVGLFFIRHNDGDETFYDVLWSQQSDKIDLFKTFLQFGLLFFIAFIIYRYLNRYSSLDERRYKRFAKREVIILIVFVFGILIIGGYLLGQNHMNKARAENLSSQVSEIEKKIKLNSTKRKLRQTFWKIDERVYDLTEFDGKVHALWNFLLTKIDDDIWLEWYYKNFKNSRNFGAYIDLKDRLGITSPIQLRDFIRQNVLTDEDFKKDEENELLIAQVNQLTEEKSNLVLYDNSELKNINLLAISILFAILYILRPLIFFIVGLFREIR